MRYWQIASFLKSRHKKTGALADAPVFSIIGAVIFSTSLKNAFFLWYPPEDCIQTFYPDSYNQVAFW